MDLQQNIEVPGILKKILVMLGMVALGIICGLISIPLPALGLVLPIYLPVPNWLDPMPILPLGALIVGIVWWRSKETNAIKLLYCAIVLITAFIAFKLGYFAFIILAFRS